MYWCIQFDFHSSAAFFSLPTLRVGEALVQADKLFPSRLSWVPLEPWAHGQDGFKERWAVKPKSDLGLPRSEPFPSLSALHGTYGGGKWGRKAEDGVGKP